MVSEVVPMTLSYTTTMRCTIVQCAVACKVPYGWTQAFCSPPSAAASAGGKFINGEMKESSWRSLNLWVNICGSYIYVWVNIWVKTYESYISVNVWVTGHILVGGRDFLSKRLHQHTKQLLMAFSFMKDDGESPGPHMSWSTQVNLFNNSALLVGWLVETGRGY